MKSLDDFRNDYGWFVYPAADELHSAVARIDAAVEMALDSLDLEGFRTRIVQAARKDLAGLALSSAEGYARKVPTFADLTRAELVYVEAWTLGADLATELARLSWLPAPTTQRIVRLLKEDRDIPVRTRQKLIERFVDGS